MNWNGWPIRKSTRNYSLWKHGRVYEQVTFQRAVPALMWNN